MSDVGTPLTLANFSSMNLIFVFRCSSSTTNPVSERRVDSSFLVFSLSCPVPLVLDLLITHERFGSSSDPSINGHLHFPNDVDRSLNESTPDKNRKYHTDNNNNPPNVISFIPPVLSTSGRLHSEFFRLLFWQGHRETNHFFTTSGVQLTHSNGGLFLYLRVVFSSHLKSKIDNTSTSGRIHSDYVTFSSQLKSKYLLVFHHTDTYI